MEMQTLAPAAGGSGASASTQAYASGMVVLV